MATINDKKWANHYDAMHQYITENGHLPDKKKVENRALLNWWKYNKKRIKEGKLDSERLRLMQELSNMRRPSNKPQEQILPLI